MGALEITELELLHDFIPDDIGGCEEPTTAARLLVGDRSSLEVHFGVENMGNSNLGYTGSQGSLYVVVGQDGAGELDLWVGSCSGFPGVNVGELDRTVTGLGNRQGSVPDAGLLIDGLASTVGWFAVLGSDFGVCRAHDERGREKLWGMARGLTGSFIFIHVLSPESAHERDPNKQLVTSILAPQRTLTVSFIHTLNNIGDDVAHRHQTRFICGVATIASADVLCILEKRIFFGVKGYMCWSHPQSSNFVFLLQILQPRMSRRLVKHRVSEMCLGRVPLQAAHS